MEVTCMWCGRTFEGKPNRKYCSQSCAGKAVGSSRKKPAPKLTLEDLELL